MPSQRDKGMASLKPCSQSAGAVDFAGIRSLKKASKTCYRTIPQRMPRAKIRVVFLLDKAQGVALRDMALKRNVRRKKGKRVMTLKTQGILCAALSAAIYGFTPILARIAFEGGANGVTVSFLRGAIPLLFLFILLRKKKIALHPGKELKLLLLAGICGLALTTLTLYVSYSYVSVGMATTLHFIYPVLVAIAGTVLFKDKLTVWRVLALLMCCVGIALFMDTGGASIVGIALSLLSGVAYTLFLLLIERTSLRTVHYLKLVFYINACIAVTSGLFGVTTGQLNLMLTPTAWLLCAIVALTIAFGALPLLQRGIKLSSASTASILSTLEPALSVVLGIIVLGESFSSLKLLGASAIIISILLITASESQTRFFERVSVRLPFSKNLREMSEPMKEESARKDLARKDLVREEPLREKLVKEKPAREQPAIASENH